jgi:hypothetical protein
MGPGLYCFWRLLLLPLRSSWLTPPVRRVTASGRPVNSDRLQAVNRLREALRASPGSHLPGGMRKTLQKQYRPGPVWPQQQVPRELGVHALYFSCVAFIVTPAKAGVQCRECGKSNDAGFRLSPE